MVFINLLSLFHFLVLCALFCGTRVEVTAGDKLCDLPTTVSRLSTVKSSFIRVEEAFSRYMASKEFDHSAGSPSHRRVRDLSNVAIDFLKDHATCLGSSLGELRLRDVSSDNPDGIAFYHFEQLINGYEVYRSNVVLMISPIGDVLHVHGHTLLKSSIPEKYLSEESYVSDKAARNAALGHLASKKNRDGFELVDGDCHIAHVSTRVWYRLPPSGLVTEEVRLALNVSGSCRLETELVTFTTFVDIVDSSIIFEEVEAVPLALAADHSLSGSASESRSLRYFEQMSVSVIDVYSFTVYFDDSYSTLPESPPNVAIAATSTYYIHNLLASLVGSPVRTSTTLYINHGSTTNVYFSSFNAARIGWGLEGADMIGSLFGALYIRTSRGLRTSGENGAIGNAYGFM